MLNKEFNLFSYDLNVFREVRASKPVPSRTPEAEESVEMTKYKQKAEAYMMFTERIHKKMNWKKMETYLRQHLVNKDPDVKKWCGKLEKFAKRATPPSDWIRDLGIVGLTDKQLINYAHVRNKDKYQSIHIIVKEYIRNNDKWINSFDVVDKDLKTIRKKLFEYERMYVLKKHLHKQRYINEIAHLFKKVDKSMKQGVLAFERNYNKFINRLRKEIKKEIKKEEQSEKGKNFIVVKNEYKENYSKFNMLLKSALSKKYPKYSSARLETVIQEERERRLKLYGTNPIEKKLKGEIKKYYLGVKDIYEYLSKSPNILSKPLLVYLSGKIEDVIEGVHDDYSQYLT